MNNKLPKIFIKIVLVGLELLFVGILCALRLQIIGWMLVILGLAYILWVVFHLALLTGFIITIKMRLVDILLYLAVHFFYLLAWLFQSDSADSGGYMWAIQVLGPWPSLDPLLNKWGDTVFWIAFAGMFVCYVLIVIMLAAKLIKSAQAKKKATLPAS